MFKAVQLMTRKPSRKPIVHDQKGRFIADDQEAASAVRSHFHDQFRGNVDAGVEPFTGRPRSLQRQISSAEVSNALKKLNNGRSPGPDGVPGELLKYGRENLAPHIACLFNSMFTTHQHLDLGCGTLVPFQKPGKTVGPPGNLRPIVLLTSLCKTLSIITLRRISSKVGEYLSPTQSGFRAGRSTADLVWSHRWFSATCQHYRREMTILGIDMSKAFDCIHRDKLLTVLESFLTEDDVRLVRVLLTNTTLQVRIGRAVSESLETTIGTPQGDSLSPVLFVIYLEAALRDLRSTQVARNRPPMDQSINIPFELVYADDTDFISLSRQWLTELEPVIDHTLGQWALRVNNTKTEWTELGRSVDRIDERWRTSRKLGSLLGNIEDVTCRRQLAEAAFRSMWSLWKRRGLIREPLRMRLYCAFIMPILLYNSGTWGLTVASERSLDAFHRRQLRSLLGITWPQKISNLALYARCGVEPVSDLIRNSRWSLFGHVLRLGKDTPARLSMEQYFQAPEGRYRGRPRVTLPIKLHTDLSQSNNGHLRSVEDLRRLERIAVDRPAWNALVKSVCAHPRHE